MTDTPVDKESLPTPEEVAASLFPCNCPWKDGAGDLPQIDKERWKGHWSTCDYRERDEVATAFATRDEAHKVELKLANDLYRMNARGFNRLGQKTQELQIQFDRLEQEKAKAVAQINKLLWDHADQEKISDGLREALGEIKGRTEFARYTRRHNKTFLVKESLSKLEGVYDVATAALETNSPAEEFLEPASDQPGGAAHEGHIPTIRPRTPPGVCEFCNGITRATPVYVYFCQDCMKLRTPDICVKEIRLLRAQLARQAPVVVAAVEWADDLDTSAIDPDTLEEQKLYRALNAMQGDG